MKVKTHVSIGDNEPGSVVELDEQEAQWLIQQGYADSTSTTKKDDK